MESRIYWKTSTRKTLCIRNYPPDNQLFQAVQKANHSKVAKRSFFLNAITALVAFAFFASKLTSPFLHTHQLTSSEHVEVSIGSPHCDACDYEATQIIEAGTALILPENLCTQESKVFESLTGCETRNLISSESRRPPAIS